MRSFWLFQVRLGFKFGMCSILTTSRYPALDCAFWTIFPSRPAHRRNPSATAKGLAGRYSLFMKMKTDEENITSWAQETLDELFSERLIPFKLTAYAVNTEGREYVIPFHDSRLHSVRFSWTDSRSFKEVFRSAVLDRVKTLGTPFKVLEAYSLGIAAFGISPAMDPASTIVPASTNVPA